MKDQDRKHKSDRSITNDTNADATEDTRPGKTRPGAPEPPRTTTGKWTSPKFGSAGSGGAELEPGPERD